MNRLNMIDILIEQCFTSFSKVFQSYYGNSSHFSCLSWVTPVLGLDSEVSCLRTLHTHTKKRKKLRGSSAA